MDDWQPFQEPLRTTLTRTIGIAIVAGGVVALWWGRLARWPLLTVVMLWPSFGGHWLELWFLNWLRPRLSRERLVQIVARIAVWFVGGLALGLGMRLTAAALIGVRATPRFVWWAAGLGFIAVELVAQVGLQLRGRPSFFNGRG